MTKNKNEISVRIQDSNTWYTEREATEILKVLLTLFAQLGFKHIKITHVEG